MPEKLNEFDVNSKKIVEKKYFENLIVLGNAVPDEISDNRKTVCTVVFSKEHGLMRIYPVPPEAKMDRWNIVSIPLEKNPNDTRVESWKIQGSKSDWGKVSEKIKITGKLSRHEWIDLITYLKDNHSYGCIEDINDKKLSLGIIVPRILDKKLESKKVIDPTIQATLINEELFMTIKNYAKRPVITYRCPTCRIQKRHHRQGVLEWGVYEWLRNNPDNTQKVWDNLRIDDSRYDKTFLVGNMNRYRSSFMIISIFRYKI